MSKLIDLTGQKFGRLTVVQKIKSNTKNSRWLCHCTCGNQISVSRVHLINGHCKSCGCYQKEVASELAKTYKTTHGLSKHKLYKVWDSMRYRCRNENCHAYADYGGRGIQVCEEWLTNFESFYFWAVNNGYEEGLTLDRKDVNGGYDPTNCRWVTMKKQGNNRRTTVNLTLNGKTKSMKQWAEEYGISYNVLQKRLRKPDADLLNALTSPLRRVLNGR